VNRDDGLAGAGVALGDRGAEFVAAQIVEEAVQDAFDGEGLVLGE
jgi:hypothetical protein